MSEQIIISLIAAIGTILTGVIGVLMVFMKAKLEKVEKMVDGRLTELLEITRQAHENIGKLAGLKEGRADVLKEQSVIPVAVVAAPVPVIVPVVGQSEVMDKIEKNTKDIATNTENLKPKTE